jgi:hypothetical protein
MLINPHNQMMANLQCLHGRLGVLTVVAMTLGPLAVAALLLTAYLFVNITGRKARAAGDESMAYKIPDELNSSFTKKEMATFREVKECSKKTKRTRTQR